MAEGKAVLSSRLQAMKFMQRSASANQVVTESAPVTLDESFWMLDAALDAAAKSAVEYEASVYMIAGDAAPGRRSFLKPSKDAASKATPVDETDVADDDMAETLGRGDGQRRSGKGDRRGPKREQGGDSKRPRMRLR